MRQVTAQMIGLLGDEVAWGLADGHVEVDDRNPERVVTYVKLPSTLGKYVELVGDPAGDEFQLRIMEYQRPLYRATQVTGDAKVARRSLKTAILRLVSGNPRPKMFATQEAA